MGPGIFYFNGILALIILGIGIIEADRSAILNGIWMITVCMCGVKATT